MNISIQRIVSQRLIPLAVGRITCLEHGCNGTTIPLIYRFNQHDGGISEGLGSLSAYRVRRSRIPTTPNIVFDEQSSVTS